MNPMETEMYITMTNDRMNRVLDTLEAAINTNEFAESVMNLPLSELKICAEYWMYLSQVALRTRDILVSDYPLTDKELRTLENFTANLIELCRVKASV